MEAPACVGFGSRAFSSLGSPPYRPRPTTSTPAVGEKRFTSRDSHDDRATRATMGACAAEIDPILCREILLERIEGRWESEVIGTKGFYASDRDRKSRAERRALTACRADVIMQSCRLRESPRPERALSPDDDAAPGLKSILEGLLR